MKVRVLRPLRAWFTIRTSALSNRAWSISPQPVSGRFAASFGAIVESPARCTAIGRSPAQPRSAAVRSARFHMIGASGPLIQEEPALAQDRLDEIVVGVDDADVDLDVLRPLADGVRQDG